jgi:hypothetical protein
MGPGRRRETRWPRRPPARPCLPSVGLLRRGRAVLARPSTRAARPHAWGEHTRPGPGLDPRGPSRGPCRLGHVPTSPGGRDAPMAQARGAVGAEAPDAARDRAGRRREGALNAWSHGVRARDSAPRPAPLRPPGLMGRALRRLESWRGAPTVPRVRPHPRACISRVHGHRSASVWRRTV